MTEELTGQAALAAKLTAVIHEFCEDLPRKDSERIGAEAARAAWNHNAVRVFRYIKTNYLDLSQLPVYRAYPSGRVTRQSHNGDEAGAGADALEFLEHQVRIGAMSEEAA